MIPVIYRKSDYLKTLKYVLNKEDAKVIDSNLAGNKASEFNKQFLATKDIKPELKNPCAHLILSIANNKNKRESLNDAQWISVARRYLQELKYLPEEQQGGVPSQYVAVRHHDRDHEHLHIIASQIRFDGTKVSDSFDYFKAQTATRLIAHEVGLEVTPTSSIAVSNKLKTKYGIDADVSDNRSKNIRQINRKGNEPSAKDIIKNTVFDAIAKSDNVTEFLKNIESKKVYAIARLGKNQEILGFAYTHKGVTMAANQVNRKLSWNKFKDTVNFKITKDDLQLITKARDKGLADIWKNKSALNNKVETENYKPPANKTDSGESSSNYEEYKAKGLKDNSKGYISIVPSLEETFKPSTKNRKKLNSKSKSQQSKLKEEAKSQKPTYVSIVPSIREVFPLPEDFDDKDENNKVSKDSATLMPSKTNENEDKNIAEIPPLNKTFQDTFEVQPTQTYNTEDSTDNTSDRNTVKHPTPDNIAIDDVHKCIRTIAAYMASTNSTEVNGDTLTAQLNDSKLILKENKSGNTLVEADYSTRTNQWSIQQSELLTKTHLERIDDLQKHIPKYKVEVQEHSKGNDIND